MESKRKKQRVPKVNSAIPAQEKLDQSQPKETKTAEALIYENAALVENLFKSREWREIVLPLILEGVASISGKYINGRFYQGAFTKKTSMSLEAQSGYQLALEELNNRIHDFILEREKLIAKKRSEENEKKSPIINPFMEGHDEA
jgi:hypothetical protein